MFDIGWSEIVLAAVIALVVLGPHELPHTLRLLGRWMANARKMAHDFRTSLDIAADIDGAAPLFDRQDINKIASDAVLGDPEPESGSVEEIDTTNLTDPHTTDSKKPNPQISPPPGQPITNTQKTKGTKGTKRTKNARNPRKLERTPKPATADDLKTPDQQKGR